MKVVILCHSLVSCWNHGNAHFLRGITRELLTRGHEVEVLEPVGGWSRSALARDHGSRALGAWRTVYPELRSKLYGSDGAELEFVLDDADLVLVHEWTAPEIVRRVGWLRRRGGRFVLLYHDTHHRLVSGQDGLDPRLIEEFDGILAFGASLQRHYCALGWGDRAWVWHEAADTTVFQPQEADPEGDLVWIGNWGDEERTAELREYLLEPAAALGIRGAVHGVRYPRWATAALRDRGLTYHGWVPNHRVPTTFARHRVTVHVPRRPYVEALPGIPTIRVFEALACGIPLVSAPWADEEALFADGCFLMARSGAEMGRHLRAVLADEGLRASLIEAGLAAIRARHTCAHRVEELLAVHASLRGPPQAAAWEAAPCA